MRQPYPGRVLARLLHERNLRQRDIARKAGISESFLSDVLHGRRRPSLGMIARLAKALDMSPAALFEQVYGGEADTIARVHDTQASHVAGGAREEAAA